MFVSADSIRTPNSSASTGTPVTGLLTVLLSDAFVLAVVRLTVTGPVVTGRLRSVVITGSVWGGGVIRSVVTGAGAFEPGVAAVLEELTVAMVTGELDVSLVTPASSPGVLDEDVVGGVSNSGNTVVDPASTGGVSEDTSAVLVELVRYFECHGERSGGQSLDVGALGGTDT